MLGMKGSGVLSQGLSGDFLIARD